VKVSDLYSVYTQFEFRMKPQVLDRDVNFLVTPGKSQEGTSNYKPLQFFPFLSSSLLANRPDFRRRITRVTDTIVK
jgi:hypothetical protein